MLLVELVFVVGNFHVIFALNARLLSFSLVVNLAHGIVNALTRVRVVVAEAVTFPVCGVINFALLLP